jgi:cytochrome c553
LDLKQILSEEKMNIKMILAILPVLFVCESFAFNPQRVYKKKCSKCHSVKSENSEKAPSFVELESKRGKEWLQNYVQTSKNPMHKFKKYQGQKLDELIDYIFAIGSGSDSAIKKLEGDTKAGRVVSTSCRSCHGPSGYSANPEIPHLRGQNAYYLINQLKAFRDGSRLDPNGTMNAMVKSLSDRDIVNISVYYEELNNN